MNTISTLAINGGTPVRLRQSWKAWPSQQDGTLMSDLTSVLSGSRWTVRARWTGLKTRERIFAEQFGRFCHCPHVVTVPSGTAALTLALEALGVGAGDEVILPALTWVACAVAVLNVGATPVFVDVDPDTYTVSPSAISAAISSRSAAILPVHWHCCVADMPAIIDVATKHKLVVVEDCAQAYGGIYAGKPVGSFGDAAAFSLHNDKLLTCGEGGIATTNKRSVYEDMQALRLDGFDWSDVPTTDLEGTYEQNGFGRLMGQSWCLSEFQAAVALAELSHLGQRTKQREQMGEYLAAQLRTVPGQHPLGRQPSIGVRPFYEFVIRYDREFFSGAKLDLVCQALTAELGFSVYPETNAIPASRLYQPRQKKRYSHINLDRSESQSITVSKEACHELMLFLHPPLLGTCSDMDDIATAFAKVQKNSGQLRH
jgi:L-glutamine:2-deoxy-scyllo-inosose/3-amino-2,3-dideoxy-scyllo-inosose aminotransferase